jgi:Holliday junction resolvase RusA-like endonuclease
MSITITLPWPSAKLSPNTHGHWRTKEEQRGEAKQIGYINAAQQAGDFQVSGQVALTWEFHPPTKAHYDLDNLVSRTKYITDGMFMAWGADDNCIKRVTAEIGKVERGGRVVVTIEEILGEAK